MRLRPIRNAGNHSRGKQFADGTVHCDAVGDERNAGRDDHADGSCCGEQGRRRDPLSYPARTIAGIMMEPMATTVAGAEPEIAAKNMQAMIAMIPRPPWMWPTKAVAKSIRRLEMPPRSINAPATIKSGMASRGNESQPENIRWLTRNRGTLPTVNIARKLAKPNAQGNGGH